MFIDEETLDDTIDSLDWMLVDIDYKNKLTEKVEDSKPVVKAKRALEKLKTIRKGQEKHYVQNG